jgi:predicted nucleic acid-binding Zn ribbon protein
MPRRSRGASSRERDPAPISEALQDLVVERGWEGNLALGRLRAQWPEVVGEQVAARSEPIKLEDGRLTIRVEGGAWAAELALLGHSLATAAARFLGHDLVREVAIVAGSPRRSDRSSEGPI